MELLLAIIGFIALVWFIGRVTAGAERGKALAALAEAGEVYWEHVQEEMEQILRFPLPTPSILYGNGNTHGWTERSSADLERMRLEEWALAETFMSEHVFLLRRVGEGRWEQRLERVSEGDGGSTKYTPAEYVLHRHRLGMPNWHPSTGSPEEVEAYERDMQRITNWFPVEEKIEPLLEDRFRQLTAYFEAHAGLHPGMTDIQFGLVHVAANSPIGKWPRTGGPIWRPPVHDGRPIPGARVSQLGREF